MGYPSGKYEKVINYYSNPKVLFNGVATGTKTQDNARVIKENRFAMAAVGDESGTCSTMSTTSSTTATTTSLVTEDGEGQFTEDFEGY